MQAVVFDFDGLIADTEGPEFDAWTQEYARHGLVLELSEWAKSVGTFGPHAWSPDRHLAALAPEIDIQEAKARQHDAFLGLLESLQPMPGLAELLDGLKQQGITCAIASSSQAEWVLGHLDKIGLAGAFGPVVTRGPGLPAKPEPHLYQEACRQAGAPPHACVAIEDSVNGLVAAKRAGMAAVAVPNQVTAGLDFSGADLVVSSLAELSPSRLRDVVEAWGQASGKSPARP